LNKETPHRLRVVSVEDSSMIRARLVEALVHLGRIEIVGEADAENTAVSLLADQV